MSILSKLRHLAFLALRPMTLGVRVAAFDAEGRVFLVRHTYIAGWHLPGGGVDPGESAEAAALREMAEEGNLVAEAPLRLVSVHFNRSGSRRDHVIVYVCALARQSAPHMPDREIRDSGFFPLDGLPDGVTPATQRRLAELKPGARSDPLW